MKLEEMFNLENKIAMITGGWGHLGRAMTEALLEFGATVFVLSRSSEENIVLSENLNGEYKGECYPIKCDLSDIKSIKRAIAKIEDKYEKIDILINNSYYGAGRELEKMSDKEWQKGIDGSINSAFRITKEVIKIMLNKGSGKIINIASMYGVVAPDVSIYEDNDFYNPANYGCGKAAIIQFSKYIASVYADRGITSNSISPGPFPSDVVQRDKKFINSLEQKVPLGRIGKPDDLKGTILLLASKASDYINGTNIVVDGGWTIR